jgi:hypothetical protein
LSRKKIQASIEKVLAFKQEDPEGVKDDNKGAIQEVI